MVTKLQERELMKKILFSLIPMILLVMLTGEPRVPSPKSRTKANADHAGLSQPPDPLKELISSKVEP